MEYLGTTFTISLGAFRIRYVLALEEADAESLG
jgi:hypothetical protein